jgi:hypothetical protein
MDEGQIEEKINHLEKRVTDGFARMKAGCAHINSLIKPLANTCAREFTAINGHLAKVDDASKQSTERSRPSLTAWTTRSNSVTRGW